VRCLQEDVKELKPSVYDTCVTSSGRRRDVLLSRCVADVLCR